MDWCLDTDYVVSRDIDHIAMCAKSAGVYILVDDNNGVLYVGSSANIRYRLRQHFGSKTPWTNAIFQIDTADRVDHEMALIYEYLPQYNLAYQRNSVFVPMSKIVFCADIDDRIDTYAAVGLSNHSNQGGALRSMLWNSGIEIKRHIRIDGQSRNLVNKKQAIEWGKRYGIVDDKLISWYT